MSYIESHLLENEEIIFKSQLHWVIFTQPLAWLIVSLSIHFLYLQSILFTSIPLLIFAIFGISTAIIYLSSEFAVTNKRILIKQGFIYIDSIDTFLSKIASIQVHQSILGRLLNYGTIIIIGTGSTRDLFPNIDNPFELRKHVQAQIEKLNIHG
ncbi:MAG: hypothetical protein LEGION0398_MBIBDBAK_00959 [Legionellaceae bacterium]